MTKKANDPGKDRKPVDMSPEAIARRLEKLEQLFQLGLSLRKAKKLPAPK